MRRKDASVNQSFQLAVNSAQKVLEQVGESLNHGEITVNGAKHMREVASEIVEQVKNVKLSPETIRLLVKLAWTSHDINVTLKDLDEALKNAETARDLVEPFHRANPNDPQVLTSLYNSSWRIGDAIADRDRSRSTQERAPCCPRAVMGHATAAPLSIVMNERRFTASCLPCFRQKG